MDVGKEGEKMVLHTTLILYKPHNSYLSWPNLSSKISNLSNFILCFQVDINLQLLDVVRNIPAMLNFQEFDV